MWSKASFIIAVQSSGSIRSASAVEPTTSANTAVTGFFLPARVGGRRLSPWRGAGVAGDRGLTAGTGWLRGRDHHPGDIIAPTSRAAYPDYTERPLRATWAGCTPGLAPGSAMASVGLIVNPSASRDVRRLTSLARTIDVHERANAVARVLCGLAGGGVESVWYMPDAAHVVERAHEVLAATPAAGAAARLRLRPVVLCCH